LKTRGAAGSKWLQRRSSRARIWHIAAGVSGRDGVSASTSASARGCASARVKIRVRVRVRVRVGVRVDDSVGAIARALLLKL
jgi:hypothetical protein